MYCPVYRCVMRSSLCLDYQDKAAGKFPANNSWNRNPQGQIKVWMLKYKPCLSCSVGKDIKEGKGDDSDVERLIDQVKDAMARKLKRCCTCKMEMPANADYFNRNRLNKDGFHDSCKECQKKFQANIDTKVNNEAMRTCTRCGWSGPEANFHIAGIFGYVNVCRKCVTQARQKNKVINRITHQYSIVLDFSEYQDILESIKISAKKNFRTLQNEILFRLVE